MKKEPNLKQMRALSDLLDTKFEGPYGIRFGLDAVIGLIPGIGDVITSALSLFIIAHAASLGVGSATLVRMAVNVMVENVLDLIPFVGNIFDFYWKANTKNMKLIEEHLANPRHETIQSRMVVGLICFLLILTLAASGYLSFKFIEFIYGLIVSRAD